MVQVNIDILKNYDVGIRSEFLTHRSECFYEVNFKTQKKMGEEGVEDRMEHEFEYPRYKFTRELIMEDEQELVLITLSSFVFTPKEGLMEVMLEGRYTYHGDKDIDTEVYLSMEFHEKCFDIYMGNQIDDIDIDDNERLE